MVDLGADTLSYLQGGKGKQGGGALKWDCLEDSLGHTCYVTAARRRGFFFLLVDLGPGAAVGGMRLEINTGNSCYLICNNSHLPCVSVTQAFSRRKKFCL